MLDTARLIETPEGVELQISPVGPVPRVLAFGIDLAIRGVVFIAIALAVGWFGDFGTGLALLCAFLLEWLYPVLFETLRAGATPGKRLLRIRVVHDNGVPVGWSGSLVRNLLRAVDFLPFGYCFGLAAMLITPHFTRLGDLAAGTIVIYDDPPPRAFELPPVEPARPRWALAAEEQLALMEFADRTRTLNEERAAEIAAVLGPIGGGSVERLQRYAAWLHGER